MNTCTTCQGGTRRYYGTHCTECAHPYPVTARPATNNEHAEQTRHSIDPQDTDGGVAAAAIEKETDGYTAEDFKRADFARHPDRSDTAYRMSSGRWSSRGFHGIDDAYVARAGWVPVQECLDPDAHWRIVEAFERAEKAEQEQEASRGYTDELETAVRSRNEVLKVRQAERDDARAALKVARRDMEERQAATKAGFDKRDATIDEQQAVIEALRDDLSRAETINREVTDAMIQRAWQVNSDLLPSTIGRMLTAALAEPTRPEGAEELDALVDRSIRGCSDITSPETVRSIANGLAEQGVRVTTEEKR